MWKKYSTTIKNTENLKVAHDTDQVLKTMTKDIKLSIIMEGLDEEACYLASLCEGARNALDNNPEFNDETTNGYPFLYGYVSEGVNYHGKKIKELVESLKELL